MKIAIITDTHWGVRNDNAIIAKHISDFYKDQFFPYLLENKIGTVFHLGDVFDRRKYINYVTANQFENDFLFQIWVNKLRLFVVAGNHDTYYKNTNAINSLDTLISPSMYAQTTTTITDGPQELEFNDCNIVLCPWINQNNYDKTMEVLKNTKAQILMGHFEIAGFEMYKGAPAHDGMNENVFKNFDMVCSGHYHHKSSRGNIHYLGAPYEITWSDFDDPRGFHVFDTETRELEFVQNKVNIFKKVWYNDNVEVEGVEEDFKNKYIKVIVQNKANPYMFDLYINALQAAGAADIKVVDDHMNLNDLDEEDLIDEAEDTLTILHNYIDKLDIKSNKPQVEKFVSSLYTEAINL